MGIKEEFLEVMANRKRVNFSILIPSLSRIEFHILIILLQKEGIGSEMKVTDIVKESDDSMPAISRALRGMEKRGLIERVTNPNDRRGQYVKSTPDGIKTIREAQSIIDDFTEAVIQSVGEKEMENFIKSHKIFQEKSLQELEKRRNSNKAKGNVKND